MSKPRADLLDGQVRQLKSRRLTHETCQKFNYKVGRDDAGEPVQIAEYRDKQGRIVAQKIRDRDKSFHWRGKPGKAMLFGQHLWSPGKRVVITEGEIDAMSVSQAQRNSWPVVSLPNGAAGARRDLAWQVEWLEQFEQIVLAFDNDDAGRKAANEAAELFTPGKVFIATYPLKDASDMLQAGRVGDMTNCLWQAEPYRPDGIVSGEEIWDEIANEEIVQSLPYPWSGVNEKTYGIRTSELVVLAAGSGVGKSQVCREVAYSLLVDHGQTVAYIALEESVKRSALGLMSIDADRPLHLIDYKSEFDEEQLRGHFEATVGSGRCYLYDHWGSMDSEALFGKIRYLALACEVRYVVLDHISIVVSGIGEGDERRLFDNIMTRLRSLAQELDICIFAVSHLKSPEGASHEEGGRVRLAQLRGSRSIGQLADIGLGLERDQQGDNPDLTTVRVIKNRYTGILGVSSLLKYDHDTGRLSEADLDIDDIDDPPSGDDERPDF